MVFADAEECGEYIMCSLSIDTMLRIKAVVWMCIMLFVIALDPVAGQEQSSTRSGFDDVPQFGGPGSVGSNLKEEDEIRKPICRLKSVDKALKPWFD
jgi:hypothetical protein